MTSTWNYPICRFVFTALSAFTPLLAEADDAVVGNGTPASCTEAAIDGAINTLYPGANFPGGTLSFDCGPNPQVITITTSKGLSGATLVDGGGLIGIDGQNQTRLFTVQGAQSQIELRAIELFGGRAFGGFGGAISIASDTTLLLNQCTLRNNTADASGGAIHTEAGAALVINNSIFSDNQAANGGAIAANGPVTVVGGSFNSNTANADQGGAVQVWFANFNATGTRFIANLAQNGGALLLRGGVSNLINVSFDLNESYVRGGAIAIYEAAVLTGDGLAFTRSNSAEGGALHVGGTDTGVGASPTDFDARAVIQRSRFANNNASTGGAIAVIGPPPGHSGRLGQLLLSDASFSSNSAFTGGAIYSQGQLAGTLLRFDYNLADDGGALFLAPTFDASTTLLLGFTQLRQTTLRTNHANVSGGGIYSDRNLVDFTSVNLIGNSAENGGGMATYGASTALRNASFIDNRATLGGGLYLANAGVRALNNLSFSGNTATGVGGGRGGDIYALTSAPTLTDIRLSHSTLLGSVAGFGSALYSTGSGTQFTINNSIVLGFGVDTCAGLPINSNGGNFMPANCQPGGINDVPIATASDVNLSAPTNNGAYVLALVPNVGSAVIDHVACDPQRSTDQRGFTVPQDGDGDGSALCDSGASERQPGEPIPAFVLFANGFE